MNKAKFRELALYIAARCESDPGFGATKLNKILFYSDFSAYARLGESITGDEYQCLEMGPAPKHWLPIKADLENRGDAAEAVRQRFGRPQKRLIPLRDPDLSKFSADEISTVDGVILELWGKSATEVSELSHQFDGWKLTEIGDTIPYETVFISRRPLTPAEIAHGQQVAARLGILIGAEKAPEALAKEEAAARPAATKAAAKTARSSRVSRVRSGEAAHS